MATVPEIKIMRSESLGHRSDVSSPEAKLGMRVEDLWDEQKPQLSPNEKLNACFESIPVSAFPLSSDSQGMNEDLMMWVFDHELIFSWDW